MAFSTKVRTDALVAAARHCCVCHRYKGVNVEVHHIIPVFEGGRDDADNAICLCFDCHADAGHYNPMHSRGTKLSPEELRIARESWHRAVRENRIVSAEDDGRFYCRYLVCRSLSAMKEITSGDLSAIPSPSPLYLKNVVGDFLSAFLGQYPGSQKNYHPDSHILGDRFGVDPKSET
jgi:hypothetical protein